MSSKHSQALERPALTSVRPAHASSPGARATRRHINLPPRSWELKHAFGVCVYTSIALHAFVIFLVSFKLPEFNPKRQQDRGLDIVLVNAKHAHAPQNPQALAQANLDGGGTVDEKVRATSPLPPEDTDQPGDSLIQKQRRVKQLEALQRELMTQAKSIASIKTDKGAPAPDATQTPPTPLKGLDFTEEARAEARQEAIVARDLQEYNQRPRKKFIGARTEEYRFAQYEDDWRHKIQRIGTLNYPATRTGRLYGSLLLTVEIKADGSVASAEITRSSGNKKLDEAALRIIHLAAPFASFPPDIRKDYDVLVISKTWTFINDSVATE
ncbi:MAG TPA: TonB family protein [Rhodocyclaceae bacterium]|nr:TonB family protein [Rhodocyclaceae bacterium]